MKRTSVVALAAALALSSCTSGRTVTASATVPSPAAKLACSNDAVSDISTALGIGLTQPLAPTWSNPTYACRYVFAAGIMVLSVTDHPDAATATTAFTSGRPAGAVMVPGLGQQAYAETDGTTVVRRNASILSVDVTGLPATFGVPPHPRKIDAITVANTILACWTEDS